MSRRHHQEAGMPCYCMRYKGSLVTRPYLYPYTSTVRPRTQRRLKASHKAVGRAGTVSAGRMGRRGRRVQEWMF